MSNISKLSSIDLQKRSLRKSNRLNNASLAVSLMAGATIIWMLSSALGDSKKLKQNVDKFVKQEQKAEVAVKSSFNLSKEQIKNFEQRTQKGTAHWSNILDSLKRIKK